MSPKIARRSLTHSMSRFYARVEDVAERTIFDRKYGLPSDASKDIALDQLGYSAPGRRDYAASSWHVLNRILPISDVGAEDVFVDIGCGMGRVVLAAARYPFKRVIGIDVVPEFTSTARAAARRNRHRLCCRKIEFVTGDAAKWPLPDDVTVAYLADPVYGDVFDGVVAQLLASVDRRPRRLRVIWRAPSGIRPFDDVPRARLVRHGRRAFRRWTSAEYLMLYEILGSEASSSH